MTQERSKAQPAGKRHAGTRTFRRAGAGAQTGLPERGTVYRKERR